VIEMTVIIAVVMNVTLMRILTLFMVQE